jgi:hypothetical protein
MLRRQFAQQRTPLSFTLWRFDDASAVQSVGGQQREERMHGVPLMRAECGESLDRVAHQRGQCAGQRERSLCRVHRDDADQGLGECVERAQ